MCLCGVFTELRIADAKCVFERGARSKEKQIQQEREKNFIESTYFKREQIPANPLPVVDPETPSNDDGVLLLDIAVG